MSTGHLQVWVRATEDSLAIDEDWPVDRDRLRRRPGESEASCIQGCRDRSETHPRPRVATRELARDVYRVRWGTAGGRDAQRGDRRATPGGVLAHVDVLADLLHGQRHAGIGRVHPRLV